MKVYTEEEMMDEVFGKKGTDARDKYDEEWREELDFYYRNGRWTEDVEEEKLEKPVFM